MKFGVYFSRRLSLVAIIAGAAVRMSGIKQLAENSYFIQLLHQ